MREHEQDATKPAPVTEPHDWFAFTACRVVGKAMGVAESDLLGASRDKRQIAFARQTAMYLAHVCYRLTYVQVAEAFGRERTTVAHACAVIEDARDEGGEFEELLDKLEKRLGDLAAVTLGRRDILQSPYAASAQAVC